MAGDRRRFGLAGFLLIAVLPCARADDDERPAATPYRPTVSTPAELSAPGWLEGEFGGQYVRNAASGDNPTSRSSVPYTFKYAFSEDWGVRVGGEAVVRVDATGSRETGIGDTGIVFKRRFAVDDDHAFGLEAGGVFPTARSALHSGSGKPDYAVNGIYSVDWSGWHTDVNAIGTRLGARDDDASRWQATGALAVSHPLTGDWQAAVEWSGTRQSGEPGLSQLLGALSYSVRRWLVVDCGGVRGLNHATPRWQAFAGATVVIGRLD